MNENTQSNAGRKETRGRMDNVFISKDRVFWDIMSDVSEDSSISLQVPSSPRSVAAPVLRNVSKC
jgi:hypothetical protein